jgi:phosphoenolpyruvate-protein phosphotransferase
VATPVLPHGAIVVADELLPSQLLALEGSGLGGVCTARGGATSHVAILAAAMGVPALCAMGPALLETRRGVTAILDADAGLLRIAPDPEALAQAQAAMARSAERRRREHDAAQAPGHLADGTRIEVFANLGAPGEAAGAAALGAEGCGLFRTELLYLDRAEAPTTEEQQAAYQAAADGLAGRPLVIRTLDAGGDKPLLFAPAPHEPNPALGLRGLRASLRRPELFRAQVGAILRVTGPGERRILLPMVTDLADLRAARALAEEVARELGVAPAKLGAMIETPASALLADQLAREADFLSVGTNDLTQYALAMDREHPELAPRLDGLHPAVLRLVDIAARAAAAAGKPISVCGGLASDPLAAPVLVGLGLGCLSASPAAVPGLKHRLRALTPDQCRAAAQAALTLASAQEVRAMLLERFPPGDLT